MSRIGKKVIQVPKGVEVKVTGSKVTVKGPKGLLEKTLHKSVAVNVDASGLHVKKVEGAAEGGNFFGMTRSLLANMVEGVTNGYTRTLSLIGVGYRAQAKGAGISLTVGFSHPVDYDPPKGITVKVDKQTFLIITGADKEMVGQVAAELRGIKPPESYHGKGIRYENEVITTKVGKAAAKK